MDWIFRFLVRKETFIGLKSPHTPGESTLKIYPRRKNKGRREIGGGCIFSDPSPYSNFRFQALLKVFCFVFCF